MPRKTYLAVCIKSLFKLSFIGFSFFMSIPSLLYARDDVPIHVDRLAALECQKSGYFVLINFFPDDKMTMTIGQYEATFHVDLPVALRTLATRNLEIYTTSRASLELPIVPGLNSDKPRKGKLTMKGQQHWSEQTMNPKPHLVEDLICYLYAAD